MTIPALIGANPHILEVTIEPDPQPDMPSGYRAVVDTDLDPGTPAETERDKLAEMVGLVEMRLRADNPALTRVVLRKRPPVGPAAS